MAHINRAGCCSRGASAVFSHVMTIKPAGINADICVPTKLPHYSACGNVSLASFCSLFILCCGVELIACVCLLQSMPCRNMQRLHLLFLMGELWSLSYMHREGLPSDRGSLQRRAAGMWKYKCSISTNITNNMSIYCSSMMFIYPTYIHSVENLQSPIRVQTWLDLTVSMLTCSVCFLWNAVQAIHFQVQ